MLNSWFSALEQMGEFRGSGTQFAEPWSRIATEVDSQSAGSALAMMPPRESILIIPPHSAFLRK